MSAWLDYNQYKLNPYKYLAWPDWSEEEEEEEEEEDDDDE